MSLAKHTLYIATALAAAAVLSACGPKVPPPQPVAVVKPADDVDLKGAATYLASDLAKQIGPAGRARKVAVDPLLDRATGQQTGVSARVESELEMALAAEMKDVMVVPLNGEGVEQTGLVATGNVATIVAPDQYTINIALTDRTSGLVIAQSAARFREAGLDSAPTSFYSDSPSLVRDRSVDGI